MANSVPKQLDRKLGDNSITATLCYPDSSRHLTGFNPMIYPDLHLIYTVNVESKGKNIEVTVDLDRPIPRNSSEKCFNLEFFPGSSSASPGLWISVRAASSRNSPTPPMTTPAQLSAYWENYHDGKQSLADMDKLIGKGYSPIVARRHHQRTLCQRNESFTSRPMTLTTKLPSNH